MLRRIAISRPARVLPTTSRLTPQRQRTSVQMPAAKRKTPTNGAILPPPAPKRRASARNIANAAATNPDLNPEIRDGPNATRASPDGHVNEEIVPGPVQEEDSKPESSLSDAPDVIVPPQKKARAKKAAAESEKVVAGDTAGEAEETSRKPVKKGRGKKDVVEERNSHSVEAGTIPKRPKKEAAEDGPGDPEADGDEEANPEEIKQALSRPPPVNSNYLPLPWQGRLGYACLNTYLRNSNPPVFSSRTCRIQSILEHRHPLQDPTQPEHSTKNRPDKNKPADVALGQRYVEALCLANVKDIIKMTRWNERYHIRFLRLSSEMFPFASHPEYGYKLAPFASEALAEAGKVIAQYNHRVTTHPGQFTQLGSPRKSVIDNAIRDLDYHDELLTLLKLPEQLNRDAVMILHMGGVFEGKQETITRFKENYSKLSQSVKNRLVLENDDVCYTVHDLLPVCEELNIPMVLDYHHHNILFDADKIREGTKDIMDLYDRIKATWTRKGIKQKMHYSEPTPPAITGRQRRKHNPRVATLPPCPPDMDLMIEAKDKEQAVFELMRTFKLPGHDSFNDILPYTRNDDNKVALAALNKKKKSDEPEPELIPEDDVGMGGPEGRVYWPPTMEEWLRPKKREVKKKDTDEKATKTEKAKKEAAELYAAAEAAKKAVRIGTAVKQEEEEEEEEEEVESDPEATPATKKAKAAMKAKAKSGAEKAAIKVAAAEAKAATKKRGRVKKEPVAVPTPSASSEEPEEPVLDDGEDEGSPIKRTAARPAMSRTTSRRSAKSRVSYREDDDAMEE